MYRVNIKKENIITNQADFQTEEMANTWIAEHVANNSFGKAEHQVEISPRTLINHAAIEAIEYQAPIDAVLDESGVEVSPAIPEVLAVEGIEAYVEIVEAIYETVPAEYVIEIEDITAEIAAREAKIVAKLEAKNKLKNTDWTKVTTITHCKEIIKNIVRELED